MTGTDRLGALLAAMFVVSVPAATVVASPAEAPGFAMEQAAASGAQGYLVTASRSPATTPAQIEQVGEGNDVETLDEGAPPAQTPPAATESASTPSNDEDVELLDQGAPPATTQPAAAPATTSAAPAPATTSAPPPPAETTTYAAPAPPAATGPALPPGFGTGQVHVSTGGATFPTGLANCHVGAVTGRAYVGVDCGEGGKDMFIGHAPTFNDFPFVVDPGFPFNRESSFSRSGGDTSNDSGFFASHRGGNRNGGEVVSASGTSPRNTRQRDTVAGGTSNIDTGTVDLTQRAKTRKPRVRVDDSGASSERTGHHNGKTTQSDTATVSTEQRGRNSSHTSVTREQKSGKGAHKSTKGKHRKAKAEGKKKKRVKSENKKRQAKADKKQKRQQEKKSRRR